MNLYSAVAVVLLSTAPALASASAFSLDFENTWTYGTDLAGYYGGGTATDGSSGPNVGVTFTNVSGLSNDTAFTYYSGAPSPRGTAYAHVFGPGETAFLNVAAGVANALTFQYSSPTAIARGIRAYSGLDGTGTLLGVFDLVANITSVDGVAVYDTWTLANFRFNGMARSFDLTATANSVLFDNIAAVPEPATAVLLFAGAAAIAGLRRRRRGQ